MIKEKKLTILTQLMRKMMRMMTMSLRLLKTRNEDKRKLHRLSKSNLYLILVSLHLIHLRSRLLPCNRRTSSKKKSKIKNKVKMLHQLLSNLQLIPNLHQMHQKFHLPLAIQTKQNRPNRRIRNNLYLPHQIRRMQIRKKMSKLKSKQ